MALGGLFDIFEIPRQAIVNILSGLNIPAQFLNPLFQIPYSKEISLGIVLLFAIISAFVGIKWMIKLAGISFTIVGFLEGLSGGIIAVTIVLGIAIIIKIIKKIASHGGGEGGFGKKEKMEFGEEKMPGGEEKMPGGEEFKMPGGSETGGGEEFKMPEEKTPSEPLQSQQSQQAMQPQRSQQAMQPQRSQQAMQPQQKVCPYCGSPLMYVPQYQRYYCPRCRRYI